MSVIYGLLNSFFTFQQRRFLYYCLPLLTASVAPVTTKWADGSSIDFNTSHK